MSGWLSAQLFIRTPGGNSLAFGYVHTTHANIQVSTLLNVGLKLHPHYKLDLVVSTYAASGSASFASLNSRTLIMSLFSRAPPLKKVNLDLRFTIDQLNNKFGIHHKTIWLHCSSRSTKIRFQWEWPFSPLRLYDISLYIQHNCYVPIYSQKILYFFEHKCNISI